MRLGGSFAALKAHAWFDKFDWVTFFVVKFVNIFYNLFLFIG